METDSNSCQSVMIEIDEPVNSHRELFNKLVASQSQSTATITTSGSAGEEPDYLQTLDYGTRCSSAIEPGTCQLLTRTRPNQLASGEQQQAQQQRRCSSLSGPSSGSSSSNGGGGDKHKLDYRSVCDLLPEDFKKEPVVFSSFRNRWYTNDEVASILTNFKSHSEWQTNELQVRPKSGAVYLYSREKVRYRQDGYCWKKRKNGRTTREDHMKLKVQGIECIYGCYVHSAILSTFHRRCYWLLQNPDIVLVHYLNQPAEDQSKLMITFNPSSLEALTRRSWTNEEIIEEIGAVFGGISQIKHMLNINIPPDASSSFFEQQQQQQQQQQQLQLYQDAPAAAIQQLQQQQQQQIPLSEGILALPTDEVEYSRNNDNSVNWTFRGNTYVEATSTTVASHETTNQHTAMATTSSSLDLIALSESFGPITAAQYQNETSSSSSLDPHHYHQNQPVVPKYSQQIINQAANNLKMEQPQQQPQLQRHTNQICQQRPEDTGLVNDDGGDGGDVDLLMDEFNLQASSLGQVDEELVSNVIESLSNVEDLHDLLAGITGGGSGATTIPTDNNGHQQQSNGGGDDDDDSDNNATAILNQLDNDSSSHGDRSPAAEFMSSITTTTTPTTTTGVSSFDLYTNSSYKLDQVNDGRSLYFYDQYHNHNHNQQQQQQLDARSSLSDETDSLLMRPSPSAPVSRSNSTGNNVNNYYSCNMSNISWSSYDSGTS